MVGLSNESDRGLFQSQLLSNRSHQPNHRDPGDLSSDMNLEGNVNEQNSVPFALDSETVRNIVDKIISKEFSNTEDNIFLKNHTNKNPREHARDSNDNAQSNDECVLSDVLSVEDLKIGPKSGDNGHADSNIAASSSVNSSNVKDLCGFPPRNPQSKPKKLTTVQSADNLDK